MTLIISIDEQHFELLQMAVMNGMGNNAEKVIAQGIPLEQVRADILSLPTEKWNMVRRTRVLDIIDKYKAEGI
jgi:hypothetical protein